jgi:hypothetical protein
MVNTSGIERDAHIALVEENPVALTREELRRKRIVD